MLLTGESLRFYATSPGKSTVLKTSFQCYVINCLVFLSLFTLI